MPVAQRARKTTARTPAASARKPAAGATPPEPGAAPDIPDLTAPTPDDPPLGTAPVQAVAAPAEQPAAPPAAAATPDVNAAILQALGALTDGLAQLSTRVDRVTAGAPPSAGVAAPPPAPAGIPDDVDVAAGELVRQVGFDHYTGPGGVETERFGVVVAVDVDETSGRRAARVAWLPTSDPVAFTDLEVVE